MFKIKKALTAIVILSLAFTINACTVIERGGDSHHHMGNSRMGHGNYYRDNSMGSTYNHRPNHHHYGNEGGNEHRY